MKITINVPTNNYVQPTEVREWLVQNMCDYIINEMNRGMWIEDSFQLTLTHKRWAYQLYLAFRNDGSTYSFVCYNDKTFNNRRIHKCEMDAVFEVLQDSGYFIFGSYCTDGTHTYTFSKKPFFDNRKATRMKFDVYID